MTLFNKKQRLALTYAVNSFLKWNKVKFVSYIYFDDIKELYVVYTIDGFKFNRTLTFDEILNVVQFDASIIEYDTTYIKDDEGNRFASYGDYFESCTSALFIDFVSYAVALETIDEAAVISINQQLNKAA